MLTDNEPCYFKANRQEIGTYWKKERKKKSFLHLRDGLVCIDTVMRMKVKVTKFLSLKSRW